MWIIMASENIAIIIIFLHDHENSEKFTNAMSLIFTSVQ